MRLHLSSGSNGVMTTMWSPAPISNNWIGLAPIVHVNLVNACEFYTTEKLTGKALLIVKHASTAGHPVVRGGPIMAISIDSNILARHSNFIY